MSCEHEKRKKIPGLLKKTVFCLKKPRKTPFFFDFLDFQASGADISAQNLKKLIEQKFLEHIFKKMGSTEIVMSSVRLSVCPSVRLSVCPSVRLSVRLCAIFRPV
jgi:hypothetical protein